MYSNIRLMSKFIIITLIIVAGGGMFFYMNTDIASEIQKEYKIVAFGDSITAGYGVDVADSYPSILEERLRAVNPGVTIINMGVSGETTAGGLKRMDAVIAEKPDVVLLGLGGNDMLRSLSVTEARSNLETMIQKFQAEGITVVLMGMKGSLHNTKQYRDEFNDIYPDLAKKYDLVLVPYFLEGVVLRSDLNIADRLHPNRAGYEKIVDKNIMPVVKGMFR